MTYTTANREPTDPLMPKQDDVEGIQPDRLFYATGVLLDAQDFQTEQLYHRSRLAQVLRYLGGSGTVAGLEVIPKRQVAPGQTDPDEASGMVYPEGRDEEIRVQPGLAIDRLGRLIEVTRPHCIRLDPWFIQNRANLLVQDSPYSGIVADVFLRFVVRERGRTPAVAAGPFDALDAVTPSRLRDGSELHLVARSEPADQLPTKLPTDPWSSIAALPATDRPAALHRLMFDAWQGTDARSAGDLKPLPEHRPNQPTTDLFLARVILPATQVNGKVSRTEGATVRVENQHRRFIYPIPAIAHLLA
jgi:hypothetical protein